MLNIENLSLLIEDNLDSIKGNCLLLCTVDILAVIKGDDRAG
jgi:hypothetical protein